MVEHIIYAEMIGINMRGDWVRRYSLKVEQLLKINKFHKFHTTVRYGSVCEWMLVCQPQSTYRGRVEIGAVYQPSQLERRLQLYMMVDIVKWGRHALGGFNVSNLMGIKRRMIDIGKKITFYFLQNVWKCTVFLHLHLKYAKSAMTQKFFFLKNINMGIKKRRILCWFQIRWCRLKKNAPKKARAKKLCEFWIFSFLCIF